MKKRRKLSAGEIRFRVSKRDLVQVKWIMKQHEGSNQVGYQSISALLRSLISQEFVRMKIARSSNYGKGK